MKKVIIFIIMIFSFMIKVNANYFTLSEPYGSNYIQINRNGNLQTLYYKFVVDVSNGEYVYCVEPGIKVSSGEYVEVSYSDLGLSEEQFNLISLYAYYGYGYKDQTELNWQLATQLLIWEAVVDSSYSIYFIDGTSLSRIDLYNEEKAQIIANIEEGEKLALFDNLSYNLVLGDTIEIEDLNNVLNKYEISITNNLDYEIVDNKIIITPTEAGTYEITLTKTNDGETAKAFYHSDGQNLFKVGTATTTDEQVITLNVKSGTINISKIDEITKDGLSEVEFTLKDNGGNIIYIGNTDSKGSLIISDLSLGTYYLYETKSQDGYILEDNETVIIIDEDNLNYYLNIKNRQEVIVPETSKNTNYYIEYLLIGGIVLVLFKKR